MGHSRRAQFGCRLPRLARAPGIFFVLMVCVVGLGRAQGEGIAVEASRLEPAAMILTTVGILAVGGIVLRVLLRAKLVRSAGWLVPILLLLTGSVLVALRAMRPVGMDNLSALIRFVFTFLAFICVLYPVALLALPTPALRTRAGVPPLIRALLVAAAAFIGLLALLKWAFPTLSLTPMFVTSGVVSIVIGLAVQDLLSNLLAGVVIGLERPFKVGDWVQIGAHEGEVLDILWRATRIRTRQNDCVLIPNNVTTRESVINFDEPSPVHMLKVLVGVTYETPCALATKALLEAATRVDGVLRTPTPEAHFRDYADSSLVYELRVWVDNYAALPAIESDVRREIWYAFKRYDITIPFPQRDVNLRPVPEATTTCRTRLVAVSGPISGTIFNLEPGETVIGRNPECGICVPDLRVSNQHAAITVEGTDCHLRDLESRHGTTVNGMPVAAACLEQGDEIEMGSVRFVFEVNRLPVERIRPERIVPGKPRKPPSATPRTEETTTRHETVS